LTTFDGGIFPWALERGQTFPHAYHTAILEDEEWQPGDPVLDEAPLQRRLLRVCTRAEWLEAAEGYRDTVVLAEPVDVLEAMCGSPRSEAPACRD
jgi:hypothetical protein